MSTDDDEDDTDRWRDPKRVQPSDDRALGWRRRRRAAPVGGVPITLVRDAARTDPDVTSPYDLLERDPDHEVQAVVQRSRRDSSDPATFGDVVKLAVALTRERSANAQRTAEAEQVLAGPHKAHRATRRHLIAAVIAAAASIAGAASRWGGHAEASGGSSDVTRIQALEHAIDRLDSELREIRFQLGRRSELERNPNSKGPIP